MADWDQEAERWGIERRYFDVRGHEQRATAEAISKIAAALAIAGPPATPSAEPAEPRLAHQGSGKRRWIISVQLYSLRSRRNWGMGDFTDLGALINTAADFGAAGIGLNPLHVLFAERPTDASPYSPNSRLFLNPLYIDVEAIADFPNEYYLQTAAQISLMRAADLIDYQTVAGLKYSALRSAYRSFCARAGATDRADFERFCAERGKTLLRFAAFETLRKKFQAAWWDWPAQWRRPDDESLQELQRSETDELDFHRFVQWVADRQLQACNTLAKARGMSVGLYIDLAVGVDRAGADAWIAQEAMLQGLSIGAPPDDYNTAGQDWGLISFNPHGLIRQNFVPLREMLHATMRHAGAIRIDHVLGLMRLYVIPRGSKPREGTYIRFPFLAMLDVIAEESRHSRCIVVGEDLGTVPENFRGTMHAWGVWSYLVMLFEREADGSFKPAQMYRESALAAFGTHDLPTYSGWMSAHD